MIDIEHAVICSVVASSDYRDVVAQGIKPVFFSDTRHRQVFELIGEHLLDYRKVPGPDAVHSAYPSYTFSAYPEPVEYYAKELRSRFKYRTIMSGITETVQPLLSDPAVDGDRLEAAIGKVLFDAAVGAPSGAPVDVFTHIRGYFEEEFKIRQQMGYLRGIGTGFDGLDRATGGYQPQQLVTFVGLPKHGKSTMMLASALEAKRQGYRVLFVTFEMSIEEQMDRLGALTTGTSLNKVMEANLVHNEIQEFDRILKQHEVLTGFTMVHDRNSMLTISGVNQTVLDTNPDIVFIDGVYMMEDERGEKPMSPQALTNITRGMKRLGQSHKIPFVVSTQALLSRSRGGLRVDSIGYTSSFLQDSDIVLGVEKKTPTISEFKAMAVRSGVNRTTYVRIDWNNGFIGEIDSAEALVEMEHKPSSGPSKGEWYGSHGRS